MLDDEVAEIVTNLRTLGSDDADIEAKRATDKLPRSTRETLSAFANTRGGVLILGLDEASRFGATGVRDPAKITADLASVCSEEMEPPLRPAIKTHRFEDVDLVVAEIPALERSRKPCYYRGAGIVRGSYVRVADGDRQLGNYEVHLMVANRGQPRNDEEPVPDVGLDALDRKLVDAFVARLRERRPHAFAELSIEDVLRRSKVLVDDQLTLAGLLALGSYPQEHFPQLMTSFVHYPTVTGANVRSGERFLDNVPVEGPIPIMVQDALAALRRNMSRRATVRGAGRIDTWEYPEAALREAIVNALAHRDYSPDARGTQVQIEMYPDRLLIRNPGGLFGPVSVDDLGEEGVSSARNATLIKLLEDVPIPNTSRTVCENRGSGIRTMLDALRDASMSPPQFADTISLFRVTFPNHALIDPDTVEWIRELGENNLTDSQCLGLAMLTPDIAQPAGSRPATQASRADRRAEVLGVLSNTDLTRAEIADATGLSDKAVARWLRILRHEDSVEVVGDSVRSPNVRYRRTGRSASRRGRSLTIDLARTRHDR